MPVCLYCQTDIAHMRKGTKFCCANHRAAWDYQQKTGKQTLPPPPPPQASSDDLGQAMLAALLRNNDLQEQNNKLLQRIAEQRVSIKTETITRQEVSYENAPLEDVVIDVQRSTSTDSATNFRLQMLFNGDAANLRYFKIDELRYALNLPHVFPSNLINIELAKRGGAKKLQCADIELPPPADIDLDFL